MHSDKEKVLLEAVKNLLDQDNLGLHDSKIEKPGSHTFQFQYENINDMFCIKILKDTNFYDSHNSAFRKVHSYKYLEDPTFEAAYASELRSMGIPKLEIELGIETIKKVREEILKGDNEAQKGWASNLDEVIQTTKEGGNKKSAEQNIPFSGIEPDNTRPVPIKVESKNTEKTITENRDENIPYDGNISVMHDIIVDNSKTWEERKKAWDALGAITGDNEEMTEESLKNYIALFTDNKTLTDQQKEAILNHFKEWSGGFTPEQMGDEDHRTYASTARDNNLDEDAVYQFLSNHR